jgi:hypothetical protein
LKENISPSSILLVITSKLPNRHHDHALRQVLECFFQRSSTLAAKLSARFFNTKDASPFYIHHHSLLSLEISAAQCHLCKKIYDGLAIWYNNNSKSKNSQEDQDAVVVLSVLPLDKHRNADTLEVKCGGQSCTQTLRQRHPKGMSNFKELPDSNSLLCSPQMS